MRIGVATKMVTRNLLATVINFEQSDHVHHSYHFLSLRHWGEGTRYLGSLGSTPKQPHTPVCSLGQGRHGHELALRSAG